MKKKTKVLSPKLIREGRERIARAKMIVGEAKAEKERKARQKRNASKSEYNQMGVKAGRMYWPIKPVG